MRTVRISVVSGLIGQVVLLAVLAGTTGLTAAAWSVGLGFGVVLTFLLARGLHRHRMRALGWANRVTLVRAAVVGTIAALVVDALLDDGSVIAVVSLAVLALILDAADGLVARGTGTVSALGQRFDMEIDAFLLLVLSCYVAQELGPWVLAIGTLRYAFAAAGWLVPWLRAPVPQRYWAKVVAATQGVALTVAAAGVLPTVVAQVALAGALMLLAESFGQDVRYLWRAHRAPVPAPGWLPPVPARAQHSSVTPLG